MLSSTSLPHYNIILSFRSRFIPALTKLSDEVRIVVPVTQKNRVFQSGSEICELERAEGGKSILWNDIRKGCFAGRLWYGE